jgi:hypothetical protein
LNHEIFISYPSGNQHIAENLAGRLTEYGLKAWVYSLDRTLSDHTWSEIETRIAASELFIFLASQFSRDASGQHQELALAFNKIQATKDAQSPFAVVPVVLDGVHFKSLPDELRSINGTTLDAFTVKSTSHYIVQTFFPERLTKDAERGWRYPKPGQWLELCRIDSCTETYFDLHDLAYFRRISPLGLFECYCPKIGGLFWFAPQNLTGANIVDEDFSFERQKVPYGIGT